MKGSQKIIIPKIEEKKALPFKHLKKEDFDGMNNRDRREFEK